MDILYELLELYPKSHRPNCRPKLEKLFLLAKKNPGLSEREMSQLYFGKEGKTTYFNSLKNELKEVLKNQLIITPSLRNERPHKKLFDEVYKSFSAYKLLLISGKRRAAISIAEKIFPTIQELELHSLAFTICADLHLHYSINDISLSNANKYKKLMKLQQKLIHAETIVRTHYCQTSSILNSKVSFTPKVVATFREAAEQTAPFFTLQSSTLNRFIYSINIAQYIVQYDYPNILQQCNKALDYFSPEHPNYISFKSSIFQLKLLALNGLSKFEEAKDIAREACQLMSKGSFNWQVALINRIRVYLQAGTYQQAYDLYRAHIQYKNSNKLVKEEWNIMKGYLYFLIQTGNIEEHLEERFNLGKFLNETPIYTRDKAGHHISILILQFIIRLLRGQYGRIIDTIESLSMYCRKHTRNPENKRANLFFQMILKMEANSFHLAATQRKTHKLLEKLNATPIQMRQNLGVEVIPFPILWQILLQLLDNNWKGLNTRKAGKLKPKG